MTKQSNFLFLLVVVALIVGIIAGPLVSNGFDPNSWQDADEITKELTRCILAIQASKPFFFILFFLKRIVSHGKITHLIGDGSWY